jgi:hypothetical protein
MTTEELYAYLRAELPQCHQPAITDLYSGIMSQFSGYKGKIERLEKSIASKDRSLSDLRQIIARRDAEIEWLKIGSAEKPNQHRGLLRLNETLAALSGEEISGEIFNAKEDFKTVK